MVIEEILSLESETPGVLHLVRDRLFWQAWERSAFLFVRLFRPYRVHSRFVQKVSSDLVWLGFPDSALSGILAEAEQNGWSVLRVSPDHVTVSGVPQLENFDSWKAGVIGSAEHPPAKSAPKPDAEKAAHSANPGTLLRLYRELYAFSLYVFNRVAGFQRSFRFSLGGKLEDRTLGMLESLQLSLGAGEPFDFREFLRDLLRVRINFRLSHDLRQISARQFYFVSAQIETMQKLAMPEFRASRSPGAGKKESSNPLPSPDLFGEKQTQRILDSRKVSNCPLQRLQDSASGLSRRATATATERSTAFSRTRTSGALRRTAQTTPTTGT